MLSDLLGNWFPNLFISRYELVSFSLTDYSKATQRGRINDKILKEILMSLPDESKDDLSKIDKEQARIVVEKHLGGLPPLQLYYHNDSRSAIKSKM